jgi:hypothetical protein
MVNPSLTLYQVFISRDVFFTSAFPHNVTVLGIIAPAGKRATSLYARFVVVCVNLSM